MKEQLFDRDVPVFMTSATLTRKNSAEAFRSIVGVEDFNEGIVNSPFDYEANLQIKVVSDCRIQWPIIGYHILNSWLS